jgi:hypothetical protein
MRPYTVIRPLKRALEINHGSNGVRTVTSQMVAVLQVMGKIFPSSIEYRAHPSSYTIVTEGCIPGSKAAEA